MTPSEKPKPTSSSLRSTLDAFREAYVNVILHRSTHVTYRGDKTNVTNTEEYTWNIQRSQNQRRRTE